MDRAAYMKDYRAHYRERIKRVSLTMAHEEYAAFHRLARRDGKTVTSIVHEHALAALHGDAYLPSAIARELAELRFLVANISNNINQLAFYSHTVRQFTEEGALLGELERLQALIEDHTKSRLRGGDDH